MKVAVEARALTKVYRGAGGATVDALRGVDLAVEAGEFVAVMGPSGCGKSTLLHLLGGLDRPTAGEVHLDGRRVDHLDESARAVLRREAVGFVFQAYNLVPTLTVAENVELPGLLARRPRAGVARRREELLASLGLAGRAPALPTELSGGEQQRVALARALVNEPAVLLADEPTGNLDSRSGAEVMALLTRVHDQGQTIVLATHDHAVASLAQRVVFLRDGEVVDEATVATGPHGGDDLARLVRLEP
jgi:putative ABC transport system ATP-binding protein